MASEYSTFSLLFRCHSTTGPKCPLDLKLDKDTIQIPETIKSGNRTSPGFKCLLIYLRTIDYEVRQGKGLNCLSLEYLANLNFFKKEYSIDYYSVKEVKFLFKAQ